MAILDKLTLIIEKYGGTSLSSVERIKTVANNIAKSVKKGDKMVVIVSAMSGETDRLLSLANQLNQTPSEREIDVLVSTGEQVTIALLSIALHALNIDACSYTGSQVKILTNQVYGKARILNIDSQRLAKEVDQGRVVVVAGYQGVDRDNNITTLGRGGSDTTAVAIASVLQADECRIYTDVAGVYTADPRVVPEACRLRHITFEEMIELSGSGARVLQIRSVEFAGKYNVPLRVLSSFQHGPGTLITYEKKTMEHPFISGITSNVDEAKVIVRSVPDQPGIAYRILNAISDLHIEVDMIVKNIGKDGLSDFTFTVSSCDLKRSIEILEPIIKELNAEAVIGDTNVAKISVVGLGMRSHAGIASTMFKTLSEKSINVQMISTSEIKISVTIDREYAELAVRALHKAFGLENIHSDLV